MGYFTALGCHLAETRSLGIVDCGRVSFAAAPDHIVPCDSLPHIQALSSLRKYPLPLQSGREARILQYFGEQICRQLDERLEKHRCAQDGR